MNFEGAQFSLQQHGKRRIKNLKKKKRRKEPYYFYDIHWRNQAIIVVVMCEDNWTLSGVRRTCQPANPSLLLFGDGGGQNLETQLKGFALHFRSQWKKEAFSLTHLKLCARDVTWVVSSVTHFSLYRLKLKTFPSQPPSPLRIVANVPLLSQSASYNKVDGAEMDSVVLTKDPPSQDPECAADDSQLSFSQGITPGHGYAPCLGAVHLAWLVKKRKRVMGPAAQVCPRAPCNCLRLLLYCSSVSLPVHHFFLGGCF